MARKPANLIIAVAALGVAAATAFGVHALQVRHSADEVARLPVVRMETVVIIGERAQAATPDGARLATNPTAPLR
jgi:hypothetical protein